MHDDLPTDMARLRAIEKYLTMQLDRAREQHRHPGVFAELPAVPGPLETVGKFMASQLERVHQQMHEVATGDEAWRAGPARGWRLQHLPSPAKDRKPGDPGRGVLHRTDCFVLGGVELDLEAAVIAMRDAPEVEECPACRPYEDLQQRATEAEG